MYGAELSWIHHQGFGDFAQAGAGRFLLALESASPSKKGPKGRVVELGCGSGIFSRLVWEAGYSVLGIDLSEEMLSCARANLAEAEENAKAKQTLPAPENNFEFRLGSVVDAEIPPAVGVAAIGEIFNYAFDDRVGLKTLENTFNRVFQALKPGGIFLFDCAGPGRGSIPPKVPFREEPNWAIYVSVSEEEDILTRSMIWFRKEGELYRRGESTHLLKLFPPDKIHLMLEKTGFEVTLLSAYGKLPLPHGLTCFLTRKP